MTVSSNRPILSIDNNFRAIQDSALDESFRGEYTGTNLIYKGFARPGADEGALVWQLAKLSYDGSNNVLTIKFPQNSYGIATNDYSFSWTNRATYTYS
jgi:hypothetical protein